MMTASYKPSCYLATKGAMVEPTYRAFQQWDLEATLAENVRRIRTENPVGGPSVAWLKMFCKILTRRFGVAETMRPLVELVQRGWDLGTWRPIMLWHIASSDPLLTDFIANWLFEQRKQGIVLLKTEAARQYLRTYLHAQLGDPGAWSDANLTRLPPGCSARRPTSGCCAAASSSSSNPTTCRIRASCTCCTRCWNAWEVRRS